MLDNSCVVDTGVRTVIEGKAAESQHQALCATCFNEFEYRLGDPLRGIAYIVDPTRKILVDLYLDRS